MTNAFHEWWLTEVGHAPQDEQDRTIFALAHRAWRAALVFGDGEVAPEAVEAALKRVGRGDTTYDDELTIRERIRAADEAVANLSAWLASYEEEQQAAAERADLPPGPIPEGATPLGGTRWRCPRCRWIGGLKKIETACRVCSWPSENDTRAWKQPQDGEDSQQT